MFPDALASSTQMVGNQTNHTEICGDFTWQQPETSRNQSPAGQEKTKTKKLPVSGRSPTSLEACMTEILINCAQKGGTDKNTTEENPKFDVTNTSITEAYSQIQSFYRSSDLPAFALRSQHLKNKHVISL